MQTVTHELSRNMFLLQPGETCLPQRSGGNVIRRIHRPSRYHSHSSGVKMSSLPVMSYSSSRYEVKTGDRLCVRFNFLKNASPDPPTGILSDPSSRSGVITLENMEKFCLTWKELQKETAYQIRPAGACVHPHASVVSATANI